MAIQKIKLDATMQEAIALINSNFNFLLGQSGTWTPVLQNATYQNLSTTGNYYKIGNMVWIYMRLNIKISSYDSETRLLIGGLPFVFKDTCCSIGTLYNILDNYTGLTAKMGRQIGVYDQPNEYGVGAGTPYLKVNTGLSSSIIEISGVGVIAE